MKGDLVYVPSSTDLIRYKNESSDTPEEILYLSKPHYLLVRDEKENKVGVFFEGRVWYVEKRKVSNV